jgi:hypothetical protein
MCIRNNSAAYIKQVCIRNNSFVNNTYVSAMNRDDSRRGAQSPEGAQANFRYTQ